MKVKGNGNKQTKEKVRRHVKGISVCVFCLQSPS